MPTVNYGSCVFGTDYSIPPHLLPIGYLSDARNILPTDSGLPTGRKGITKLSTTAVGSKVTSLHEFRSGSTRNTLISYGTKIACYNSVTGVFDDEIASLTTGKMFQWVNFAGKAIGVNEGANNPQYFTDVSTHGDLAGSWPKGLCVAEWANRVWIGGDSTNVALLTGSALNDPTSIANAGTPTGGVSQTVGDSKDPIIGLYGFFDMLLVGKKNALYKAIAGSGYPPTNGQYLEIRPVYTKDADSTGFTSPWAITQVGNDVIYLDGYDIKRLSGIQEFGDITSASVIPHFKDFLKATVSKDYLQYTQFFHYKKLQQIWISIPTGATTHFVFVLDYRFKEVTGRYSFYPMYGMELTCINGIENGEVLDIYAGDESGYVHQLDIGNDDNGAVIDRYFVNTFAGNDEDTVTGHTMRKQFLSSETFISPEQAALSMIPSYAIDLFDDAQIRTSGNYTALDTEVVTGSTWSGTGTKRKSIPFFGLSSKSLSLKWSHGTVAQNFTFFPSVLKFVWKSRHEII